MVALTGGRPLSDEPEGPDQRLRRFPRRSRRAAAPTILLSKARDRAHVLVGLAIAVANIDEVIHLIRTAPDPATARERLMARDWPATDIAPLVALIADPRHRRRRGRHLSAVRRAGARHPRTAPAAPDRARP